MRQNLPVTHHEVIVADGELLVSRTNLKGIIVDANQAFVKISGYSEAELIGQPHNLVRHPDMPPEAFADLWSTLKQGRPWVGIVKNRCKNGDHYWVEARVTPLRENGQITGYMSVRRNVSRERIDAAQALYARMRAGNRRQRLVHGSVYGNSPLARAGFRLRQVSLRHRMQLMLMLPVLMLALAWLPSLAPGLAEGSAPVWLRGAESALAVLALLLGVSLIRSIVAPLEEMVSVCRQITAGNYFSPLDVSSAHEVGQLRHELLQMQTQLGFSVAEAERQAAENRRIRFALDTTTANVMVADTNGNIVYGNESVMAMLAGAESDLRKDLPNFRVNEVIGNNFDVFHRNPQHQRNLLAKLTGTYRAQITVGGRPFVLIASPIHDNRNERIGTVVEWVDRLSEVIVEREVKAVVDGAVRGELSRRIDTARTTGTVQQLSLGINALLDRFESVMSEVLALLNGLANGNLDCRIEGDHQGTFAQMQHDANRTAEQLSRIVGDISHAIEALSMASREIAGGNADLSQRTSAQASSLEQTVGAIQQIANAARRNAEHAQRAKQLSGNASTVADAGGTLVQTVVGTMQDIAAASARIADIISVIDGIAFQTNILALNAAVEAARAGDQGRGFAVVAAEVRELAQRSALSAKDIRALINDSSSKVRSGVEQVQQAGATMTEIVSANRQVGDIVAEIAASSTAQSGDVDRINGAMEQMDEGTQQNAALVEETAAAARSMEEQVQALSHAVAVFRRPGAQAAMPQAIAA